MNKLLSPCRRLSIVQAAATPVLQSLIVPRLYTMASTTPAPVYGDISPLPSGLRTLTTFPDLLMILEFVSINIGKMLFLYNVGLGWKHSGKKTVSLSFVSILLCTCECYPCVIFQQT